MKKEKSCGCIVFNDESKVLLIHMKQGHWSFPKGHVEGNETEVETAIRETLEETNIKIDIDNRFRRISSYSPFRDVWKDVILFVGFSQNNNIIIQKEELQDAKFVDIQKAKELITYEKDLKIFIKALKYLNLG